MSYTHTALRAETGHRESSVSESVLTTVAIIIPYYPARKEWPHTILGLAGLLLQKTLNQNLIEAFN